MDADWEARLDRGFLEVEGDVSEAIARRRHERRRTSATSAPARTRG